MPVFSAVDLARLAELRDDIHKPSEVVTIMSNIVTLFENLQEIVPSDVISPREETGTAYTIVESDNGARILFQAGTAVTVTIPSGLPLGFRVELTQYGAGAVSLVAGAGTPTINPATPSTSGQYKTMVVTIDASDGSVITAEGSLA